MSGRKVVDFCITKHGLESSQYFQGHGIALTQWDDCATGVGHSEREALDDALEQLASNGWDIEGLEKTSFYRVARKDCTEHDHDFFTRPDFTEDDTDCHVYVSVDVMGEDQS